MTYGQDFSMFWFVLFKKPTIFISDSDQVANSLQPYVNMNVVEPPTPAAECTASEDFSTRPSRDIQRLVFPIFMYNFKCIFVIFSILYVVHYENEVVERSALIALQTQKRILSPV